MITISSISTVYTHSGVFHADDVACVALLHMLGFCGNVERVRNAPDIIRSDEIVIDIGGIYNGHNRFDHHQPDCPVRDDGVKYASFGLLVKDLGICNEPGFETFDAFFAEGIDARDNGQWDLAKDHPSPIGNIVSVFNPTWDSGVSEDEAFDEAVAMVRRILEKEFARRRSAINADDTVRKALDEGEDGIIVLPKFMPWKDTLKRVGNVLGDGSVLKGAAFISRGEWVIFLLNGYQFPLEWNANPPKFVKFCHAAGFMVSAETLEDILEAARFIKEVV